MTALPDYAEALGTALGAVEPVGGVETVDLGESAGRVLAEALVADRDLPPFNRAQMDGYAVRGAEVGRIEAFEVAATIPAGQSADVAVPPGHCVAVATGAPLPDDVDTVIQHELSDRANPVQFRAGSIETGHAVHHRGADARRGDTLVAAGTVIEARHVGIAAAVGRTTVPVAVRPRATILTSGDEVMPVGAPVATHQIRNSNAPMIRALLDRMGAEPVGHHHVADNLDATQEAVGTALEHSELLVTVGGISAGERDFFPAALAAHRIALALKGAAIQPGRPVLAGRSPDGPVVLGLPGNPVSVLACMCLFGRPMIRALLGLDTALPWEQRELAEQVAPNPRRRAFRPAILLPDGRCKVPPWAGSGDLAHTAPTHGLLELPVQEGILEPGAALRFLPWP